MTRHRAFTLVELSLAVVIGAMIAVTCFSLMAALSRTDKRLEQRQADTMAISLTHGTIERAMQQLLMDNATRPNELDDPENIDEYLADGGASRASTRPRFLLEEDTRMQPVMRYQPDPMLPAQFVRPQRFEIALKILPVFTRTVEDDIQGLETPEAVQRYIDALEEHRRLVQAGDQEPVSSEELRRLSLDAEEAEGPQASEGIRGVFELLPDREIPGTWAMWWRAVDQAPTLEEELAAIDGDLVEELYEIPEDFEHVDYDNAIAPGLTLFEQVRMAQSSGRVRLMGNITKARWEVYRDSAFLDRIAVVWSQDLPAYVTLEVETASGRWNKWMFEVAWTRGSEPGQDISTNNNRDDDDGRDAIDNDEEGVRDAGGISGRPPRGVSADEGGDG